MTNNAKNHLLLGIGLTFILSIIFSLCLFWYKGIWPFGNDTVIWADMSNSISLLYYFYDVLRGEDSFYFTWRYGGGLETLGIVSQQGLLNPINCFILFFDREYIYGSVGLLLIFKISLMASSMYFYINKYRINMILKIVASMAYSLGMSVLLQYPIMFTIDAGIILPLIMNAYHKVVDGKNSLFYIFILTISIVLNLYTSIFVLLYLFLTTFWLLKFDCFEKSKSLVNLFYSTAIAIIVSSFMWIPVFLSFATSARVNVGGGFNFYQNCLKTLSLQDSPSLTLINLSLFFALIIFSYFYLKEVDAKIKSVCCISISMLFAILIPTIELTWHMGSHMGWPWRFSFIFQFAIIECAVVLYERFNKCITIEKYNKVIYGVCLAICLIIGELYHKNILFSNIGFLIGISSVLFVVLYLIVLFGIKASIWKNILILLLFVFEISCNSTLFIGPNWNDRDDRRDTQYVYDAINISYIIPDKINDKLLRTKDYDGTFASGYSAIMKVHSIANWLHVVKKDKQKVLSDLGYSVAGTRFLDNGGTILSDLLLGYRQAFSMNEINSSDWDISHKLNPFKLYKSVYDIPIFIPFINNEQIYRYKGNCFDIQNNILCTLTDCDDIIFKPIMITDSIFDEGLKYKCQSKKCLYLYSNAKKPFKIIVNGKYIKVPNLHDYSNENYPVLFNNGIINLGTYNKGDNIVINIVKNNSSLNVTDIIIYEMDYNILENKIYLLNNKSSIYDYSFTNTSVNITLNNEKFNMLYLPILYDDNWLCTINGENKKLSKILGGFLGVPLSVGVNSISIKYLPVDWYNIIFVSIILVILICYIKRIYFLDKVIRLGCYIFICFFMVFVYMIPLVAFSVNCLTYMFKHLL